jgi:hypothetical protein
VQIAFSSTGMSTVITGLHKWYLGYVKIDGEATPLPNHKENSTEKLFCMTWALKSN